MLPAVAPYDVPHAEAPPRAVDPGRLLVDWLADAAGGDDLVPRLLRHADGHVVPLPLSRWARPAAGADETMLQRAVGPVLDVGCGPGRLTAALHGRGVEVLGLELVGELPVLARAAGAPLLVGDLFGPVPGAGRWRTMLLADGNIGIGGDPVRVLRRLAGLLAAGGQLLVELHPEPAPPSGRVRLETLGTTSAWFSWAVLGKASVPAVANAAGLRVHETWTAQGREFTSLALA